MRPFHVQEIIANRITKVKAKKGQASVELGPTVFRVSASDVFTVVTRKKKMYV